MEAEERLREAEARYRHLVEQLPAAVYIDAVDELSTALYISPQYEGLTGYTPEERLTEPGLWAPDAAPRRPRGVMAESERTNAIGRRRSTWTTGSSPRTGERSGSTTTRRSSTTTRREPSWQGVLTDITERQLAEEALTRRDRILEAAGFAAERFLERTVVDRLHRRGARTSRRGRRRQPRLRVPERTGVPTARADDAGLRVDRRRGSPTSTTMTTVGIPYADGGFARWERFARRRHGIPGPVRSSRVGAGTPRAPRHPVLLVVPIFVDGEWWGFIGFDQCEEERDWQPAEIDALSLVANTLGAAIGRERARTLSETEAGTRR